MTLLERLWSNTETIPECGCWLWTGYWDRDGYGKIGIGKRGSRSVHRLGYELLKGPIPEGLQLDHLCGVPACWNPEHLEAVTPRVNNLRSNSLAAQNSRKTYCHQGHPLSGENLITYTYSDRLKRQCRTCKKATKARNTRLLAKARNILMTRG